MNKQAILSSIFVALPLLVVACGTSPDTKFYILNAVDRDISVAKVTTGDDSIAVKIGPVSIPDSLDQSRIVTRSGSNRLDVDEFNRWGGDFRNDFQRILGENISILLPTDHVILNQEVTPLPIDFQVIVNVRKFDGKMGGVVTLNADWTVVRQGKEKTVTAKKSLLQENTDGVDYQAYVATQSRLLAKLSQEIADEIRMRYQEKNR